jgi:signal transduction histidine kinase
VRERAEELESSQEELQSVNEELQTLNDQLNQKIAELRESNDDLANLFRVSGIPTIFVDTRLRLKRLADPANLVLNAISSDVGRPLTDITHHLVGTDPAEEARAVLENLARVEKEVQSKDGRWHLMRAVPYRTADNRIEGVIMTFTDVTALKSAEQSLRELNATLERRVVEGTALSQKRAEKLRQLALKLTNTEQSERSRLAQILHDSLQQNLAAARLHVMTGAESVADTDARAALVAAGELLSEAIGTSRSLTSELCPAPLYTGGLEAALQWLAHHMEERFGLKTTLRADVTVEPSQACRILVYRTVQELLTNVSKHSGSRSAEVRLVQRDARLQVTVSDTGAGFDVKTVEKGEQTGFGLFSIRERIQALGGTMHIESAAGKGTRVDIELPLLVKDEVEAAGPGARYAPAALGEAGEAGTLRVLIADDHEIVRCALADMLAFHQGLRVVGHAANGREAVEKAWEVLPDIVLMDVRMPEMDGIEATRRIVAELPGTVIIGLSAHEDPGTGRRMMDAGAVAYVDKSGPPDELFDVIRRFGPVAP